jgi:hypothetical protein
MDQPIRPRVEKARIRVIRDERGFTRYQLSYNGGIIVESLSLEGAWKWAKHVYQSKGVTA